MLVSQSSAKPNPVFASMESSLLNGSSLPNDSLFINCQNHFLFSLIWVVLSAIFVILGLPVTTLKARGLIKKSHQNVSNELFIINLIIINLVYLSMIPFSICNDLVWHYKGFECITSIMEGIILAARPLFVTCVCVDCYFAVVRPITYRSNKKIVIRKAACFFIWLNTICFSVHKCYKIYSFPPTLNSAPLIFSLPVIIFCNISTLQVLRKSDATKKNHQPEKKQALLMIFYSLVLTLVVYTPAVVIFSLADLMPLSREMYKCTVGMFGFLLSSSGCVIMPILHLHALGKLNNLQDSFKKYLCI